jgi:uncharacterized protein (DUF1330 family)
MPTYYFVDIKVTDPDGFALYVRDAPATVAAHGGRFVIRNPAVDVLSGDWGFSRLVVIEFADRQTFDRWYCGPQYRPIRELRNRCTEVREAVIEGAALAVGVANATAQ